MVAVLFAIGELIVEIALAAWTTTKILALLGALAAVLYVLFTSSGWNKFQILLQNFYRAAIRSAQPLITELLDEAKPVIAAVANSAETVAADMKAAIETPALAVANSAFEILRSGLYAHSHIQPAEWVEVAADAFADAVTWGVASAAVTGLFESMFPEKLNTFNAYGPMFKELAGFHEVQSAYLRPILQASIAIPAGYDAHAQFRAIKPSLGQGSQLYARRKIGLPEFQQIQAWAGIDSDFESQITALAFRPISPRAIATAITDTPFPTAQLKSILEDNGLSDTSVQFMLDVLEYNSTKNVRQQYVAALVLCYEHGAMSDQELQDSLNQLGWSTTAIHFVIQTVALRRRIQLAAKVEAQIVPLVANGNITDVEGTQQLEAAGIQPWYADLEITLASTKAEIHAAKLEAAAEAKLAAQEQRAKIRAAVSQFEDGVIDAAGLAAALVLAGMNPVIVASTVAVEEAKRIGRVRTLYGQQLTAQQAKMIQERANTIIDQMKKQLITPNAAYDELKALGIDDPELNAIFARAAADLAAQTKHGLRINPYTGQPQ